MCRSLFGGPPAPIVVIRWSTQKIPSLCFAGLRPAVHSNMLLRSILAAGGTPAGILLHWRSQCSTKRKNMLQCCTTTVGCGAAFHCEFQCTTRELWCIGVRSAGESCRSHKVRCLHLTVNSQWKLFTFTPKRSFGVKTVWNPAFGWISHSCTSGLKAWSAKAELRPYGLSSAYTGPALTGWTSLYCRPYGLQYAFQALRPEMQKEKKYASFQAVRPGKMLLQLRPYGLSCKRPGLTAWP